MLHDAENTLFTLAADFINYTNRSVFLTGRAGTGKTTFLKYIKANTIKQTVVVAPTGVAAINAGGVTIHSFFQLPFTPFIPERRGFQPDENSIDKHHLLGRIKMNNDRRKVLQELELLIIDEISMVRCDVLDAIDIVLRHFRYRHNEPFGGVQVLFIGDMYQLPPVVPDAEWVILSQHYNSPFFFDSKVIQLQEPVHIELNKIYRQNEEQFIRLLNKVRNNEMDYAGFDLLNSRFDASFEPAANEGYITLTTHNNKADAMNAQALGRLAEKAVNYKATITGEFYEKTYPAEPTLQLKIGAQVMMIKNDTEKRYFNGKIGVVTKLENETVHVQCKDDSDAIEIRKEKWENIRYTLNQSSQQVDEDVIGTFEQFPLRLAWAITIHKSQGLTFEKAVIDAGAAFAAGQVYVALSRCTTLNGIVLKSRINNNGLHNDDRIVRFSQQKHAEVHLYTSLDEAKKTAQATILKNIFELNAVLKSAEELQKVLDENSTDFNEEAIPWMQPLEERLNELQVVFVKFQTQLQQLLQDDIMPEQNTALQKRLTAAADYFAMHLQNFLKYLPSSVAITDSIQKAKLYNDALLALHTEIAQKFHAIQGCKNGFNAAGYYTHKKQFLLPQLRVNAYAAANKSYRTDTPHPELYRELRMLRDKICAQKDLPVFMVASGATLEELVRFLPQTKDELAAISGFGKVKLESYGQVFLDIINAYSKQRGLVSLMQNKEAKRKQKEKIPAKEKPDSKLETYKLFQSGKTVAEIAAARNFSQSTIEGHLAHYVQLGTISIEALVSKEKILLIEPLAQKLESNAVAPLKEQLGDAVTYSELRLVIASLNYLKEKNTE